VTITGSPHRDPNFRFIHAQALTAANGQVYSILKTDRLYSPSLSALSATGPAGGIAIANATSGIKTVAEVPKASGIARFAGRWQQPFTPPGADSALPLNAAGVAARNAYDQKASPANTCEPMSIPDIFNAPFYLFEVTLDGQRVTLHNEAYEIVRTVTLGGPAAPVDPKGQFGTASAKLDGDALVIESKGYPASKWGLGAEVQILGGGKDVPSSTQKTVTERYTVSPDGRTLGLDYTVNDPTYLTKPYAGRLELTRVPDTTALYPYKCDVESAAMWSRNAKDKALKVGQ
jgi:hypothetical protein